MTGKRRELVSTDDGDIKLSSEYGEGTKRKRRRGRMRVEGGGEK